MQLYALFSGIVRFTYFLQAPQLAQSQPQEDFPAFLLRIILRSTRPTISTRTAIRTTLIIKNTSFRKSGAGREEVATPTAPREEMDTYFTVSFWASL